MDRCRPVPETKDMCNRAVVGSDDGALYSVQRQALDRDSRSRGCGLTRAGPGVGPLQEPVYRCGPRGIGDRGGRGDLVRRYPLQSCPELTLQFVQG